MITTIPCATSRPAGVTLGDRYRLDTLLATGAWGQVWRALDVVLGRRVAVKVLRREHTGESAALNRFRAEARLSACLAHPNIAALHDYGEVELAPGHRGGRLAYLVMDLVDGEALSTVLRRERRLAPGRRSRSCGRLRPGWPQRTRRASSTAT